METVHSLAHYGRRQTWKNIRRNYFWPGMTTDIHTYVKECSVCQQNKMSRKVKRKPIKFPCTSRFHTVDIDLVGPLRPSSKGNQFIMTMMDRFTQMAGGCPNEIDNS